MWNAPPSASSPAASPPPSGTARRCDRRRRPPRIGALLAHITGGHVETIDAGPRSFQPMNVNFGLFPPLARSATRAADGTRLRGTEKTLAKRRALTARALSDLDLWSRGLPPSDEANAALVPAVAPEEAEAYRHHAARRILEDRSPMKCRAKGRILPADGRRRSCSSAMSSRPSSAAFFATAAGDVPGGVAASRRGAVVVAAARRPPFNRERRALAAVNGLGVAPPLLYADDKRLVRGYIPGSALKIARPFGDLAYFRSARAALRAVHRLRITHNDLAKEQNWLRSPDGRGYLLDFQLASVFSRRSRLFRILAYEDLRHFLKHKRRYVPDALTADGKAGAGAQEPADPHLDGDRQEGLHPRDPRTARLHRFRRRRQAHGL